MKTKYLHTYANLLQPNIYLQWKGFLLHKFVSVLTQNIYVAFLIKQAIEINSYFSWKQSSQQSLKCFLFTQLQRYQIFS